MSICYTSVSHSRGVSYEEQKQKPFGGCEYKNIKWVKHIPINTAKDLEEGVIGQTDIGRVDLDGDGKEETLKVMWMPGVSANPLTLEIYKADKQISKLQDRFGVQSNYKVEDVDKDGKKEIIIWSGLWDFRLIGEDGVTDETYEGHSASHRYVVATYKLMRGEYYLWDIYTTKKKYEAFCEEQPKD